MPETLFARTEHCSPLNALCILIFILLFATNMTGQATMKKRRSEFGTSVQGGSPNQNQSQPRLGVALRTDRDRYRANDRITIELLLINNSQAELYIYSPLDWGESSSFSLWVKDADSGKNVPQNFIADAMTPPPNSKDDFVKLPPNHIYGVRLVSSLSHLTLQQKGTYDLVVDYHSPIPSNMSFGLPIWSRENGTVSSNRVRIAVGN